MVGRSIYRFSLFFWFSFCVSLVTAGFPGAASAAPIQCSFSANTDEITPGAPFELTTICQSPFRILLRIGVTPSIVTAANLSFANSSPIGGGQHRHVFTTTVPNTPVAEPLLLYFGGYAGPLQEGAGSIAELGPIPVLLSTGGGNPGDDPVISGDLEQWHKVSFSLPGPNVSETSSPNPFLQYNLEVTFTHTASGKTWVVPGYFAADGDAANSSANSGDVWRANFTPSELGHHSYQVSFEQGERCAIDNANCTSAGFSDGLNGEFVVEASNATGADMRNERGRLMYDGNVGALRFQGNGDYFLKAGANSPENFLAYAEFDATTATHHYNAHFSHYASLGGGPTWQGGKGKAIMGTTNYLASKGINAQYMLFQNVEGDGDDVWPWVVKNQPDRYDVSKLAQWARVFENMNQKGVMLHGLFAETENDDRFDDFYVPPGDQRKLMIREFIARFGHLLAVTWNIGEENDYSTSERLEICQYISDYHPYIDVASNIRPHCVVHTDVIGNASSFSNWFNGEDYNELLGEPVFTGLSVQADTGPLNFLTAELSQLSCEAGVPWVVSIDELGPANGAGKSDSEVSNRLDDIHAIWSNYLGATECGGGGQGHEWYFGYHTQNGTDLTLEDFSSRDGLWEITRYATHFFEEIVGLENKMSFVAHNDIGNFNEEYINANAVNINNATEIIVTLKFDRTQRAKLTESPNRTLHVCWYDMQNGGSLQRGSVTQVNGGGSLVDLGTPPDDNRAGWVAYLKTAPHC